MNILPNPSEKSNTSGCCCKPSIPQQTMTATEDPSWNMRYLLIIAVLAVLWWLGYSFLARGAKFLVFDIFGMAAHSHLAASLEFFIYDTVKILMLLLALIYGIAWFRASMDTEKIRDFLKGKNRGLGYLLGAVFGSVTPFCSCSSIPLFLGFTTARIPMGITMAFLITSPLINEIAVVLLWGLLGWKFTLIYVAVGMGAGIIGGFVMDLIGAERWLRSDLMEIISKNPQKPCCAEGEKLKMSLRLRHEFAWAEMTMIFKKVWKWVLIGVGIGAALHGFVPDNWFAEHLGQGQWWTVPAAVFVAIPLYSNVTGIVPIMESLLFKGLPLGTTLAFCMSAVAASIPEVMMLRQIMTIKLQAIFIFYLWVIFTLAGWLFNILGPFILI